MGETTRTFGVSATGNNYGCSWDEDSANEAVSILASSAWSVIVDRLGLRSTMSARRFADLEKALRDRRTLPPITEENVRAFAARFSADMAANFAEAVHEVFDWLRPHEDTPRAAYKTNQKNARTELGETVVLSGMIERGWLTQRGPFQVRHGNGYASDPAQRLIALENVFRMLDGQGGRAAGHYSDLHGAIDASPDGTGRTGYFAFRAFKNGNLHLRFLRPDMLARFNQIAGGPNLKENVA
jgi:hypothetical protein